MWVEISGSFRAAAVLEPESQWGLGEQQPTLLDVPPTADSGGELGHSLLLATWLKGLLLSQILSEVMPLKSLFFHLKQLQSLSLVSLGSLLQSLIRTQWVIGPGIDCLRN